MIRKLSSLLLSFLLCWGLLVPASAASKQNSRTPVQFSIAAGNKLSGKRGDLYLISQAGTAKATFDSQTAQLAYSGYNLDSLKTPWQYGNQTKVYTALVPTTSYQTWLNLKSGSREACAIDAVRYDKYSLVFTATNSNWNGTAYYYSFTSKVKTGTVIVNDRESASVALNMGNPVPRYTTTGATFTTPEWKTTQGTIGNSCALQGNTFYNAQVVGQRTYSSKIEVPNSGNSVYILDWYSSYVDRPTQIYATYLVTDGLSLEDAICEYTSSRYSSRDSGAIKNVDTYDSTTGVPVKLQPTATSPDFSNIAWVANEDITVLYNTNWYRKPSGLYQYINIESGRNGTEQAWYMWYQHGNGDDDGPQTTRAALLGKAATIGSEQVSIPHWELMPVTYSDGKQVKVDTVVVNNGISNSTLTALNSALNGAVPVTINGGNYSGAPALQSGMITVPTRTSE